MCVNIWNLIKYLSEILSAYAFIPMKHGKVHDLESGYFKTLILKQTQRDREKARDAVHSFTGNSLNLFEWCTNNSESSIDLRTFVLAWKTVFASNLLNYFVYICWHLHAAIEQKLKQTKVIKNCVCMLIKKHCLQLDLLTHCSREYMYSMLKIRMHKV